MGEIDDAELKSIFVSRALMLNVLAIIVGVAVFIAAELSGLQLVRLFTANALSLASMIGATVILIPLWIAIRRNAVQAARALVAAQVALVLIGWFRLQFPMIISSKFDPLTIYNAAAPDPTLRYLLYALIGGSVIIFPALAYLLIVFKVNDSSKLSRQSQA
jgi:cytochrome bd ubiquinol oxidase subunit II